MPRATASRSDRPRPTCALILAAGLGKRMRSRTVKLLHPLCGRAMILFVVEVVFELAMKKVLLIVGNQQDEVRACVKGRFKKAGFVLQKEQLGTGHAVLQAQRELGRMQGDVLILNGDLPTLRRKTLQCFLDFHREHGAVASLLTTMAQDPRGYGRIIRNYSGDVARIVEESDANPEEAKVQEINSGTYLVETSALFHALKQISNSNRQGEYYLTDIVEVLRREGKRIAAFQHPDRTEVLGVNDRVELAQAQRVLWFRKARSLMLEGVTILDPEATYIDHDVRVGRDSVIYPGALLEGRTTIGKECAIGAGCHIMDSTLESRVQVLDYCRIQGSRIQKGARVGPFAHLRPETLLREGARIGNFVETKKSTLGKGSKANHLTYLGDSEIGKKVNIGAGTITCNYDGTTKHRTCIEDRVFIGSGTQLVAPVRIGRGAYVGAGSTITSEVPPHSLALSRGRQFIKKNWARMRRAILLEAGGTPKPGKPPSRPARPTRRNPPRAGQPARRRKGSPSRRKT